MSEEWKKFDNDGCVRMVAMVIKMAIKDYLSFRKKARKHPQNTYVARELAKLERFFKSRYCAVLLGVDMDAFMERIDAMCGEAPAGKDVGEEILEKLDEFLKAR